MRKLCLITAITSVLPAIAYAQVTEEVVTLSSGGQELVGTLLLPGGDPAPVVLMLHGFTGSRDELATPAVENGVFAHTAAVLADKGFASLRIDFRGSGESTADITYEATTFEGQIADALAAVDYLEGLDAIDTSDINLIGWSQGGLVAAAVAGRSDKLDAVALWQAVGDVSATYEGLLTEDFVAEGKSIGADETISTTLPWGAEVSLNGAFFQGMDAIDPLTEIAAYSGPLFVTQGTTDTTVLPENADAFIAAHEGPEELWAYEMDHSFNVFADAVALDAMIDATASFFEAN
ncbi:alpha/beta hydrolase family protein [Loktanella salsilacus]|uniref:alpha/beta hydrolase family protein n=1 Tax=Loktanella salsilacus TaxID=195913 RepID=UPI003734EE9D